MSFTVKNTILSAAVAATLAPIAEASAGEPWRQPRPRDRVEHRHHDRDVVAAGILGLAVGALIVGAINQANEPAYDQGWRNPRPRPDRDYFPPAPHLAAADPDVIYAEDYGAPEPWSRDWRRWCTERYQSFDAQSGTYRGYDGRRHFCAAE